MPKSRNELPNRVGGKAAQCSRCKEVFSANSNFDKHLKRVKWSKDSYRMKCVDPESVGLVLNSRDVWAMPGVEREYDS